MLSEAKERTHCPREIVATIPTKSVLMSTRPPPLDSTDVKLSTSRPVALLPYLAALTAALALVIAVFVVMLVVWSTRDAPNYWGEEKDDLGTHNLGATSSR
jgi:hypothetical protein